MKQLSKYAFTLVELIVVVVILGVLAAVGLVSYSSYLGGARDSNRITQLSDIKSGLNTLSSTQSLPLPEDSIQILASSSLIGYQGYAGESIIKTIGYTNGGKDPYDDTYFTYFVSKNMRDFQLLAYLEEDQNRDQASFISQTYAETPDYTERFPVVDGKALGVLIYTEDGSYAPAQEVSSIATVGNVDIVTTGSNFDAYYTNDEVISGTGGVLKFLIPNKDCERIQELGNHKGSGIYRVNPTGASELQVYCDMETDGGGWTRTVKIKRNDTLWNAYAADMNPASFLSGTGGINFAQFTDDISGEDLEYMIKVDGVQKGTIYSGVKKEAWDNLYAGTYFDDAFYQRTPNDSLTTLCKIGSGIRHNGSTWHWSIVQTNNNACDGYVGTTGGKGFLLTSSSGETAASLYGLGVYNANITWGTLEIFIR